MEIALLIENLSSEHNEGLQLGAIDQLAPHIDTQQVFDEICQAALRTLSAKIRSRAILALQPQAPRIKRSRL